MTVYFSHKEMELPQQVLSKITPSTYIFDQGEGES